MNNNGRKISSKYLLTLIFTACFFSVTFNSPANYPGLVRFCKILTTKEEKEAGSGFGADTTKPWRRIGADTIPPRAVLPALAPLVVKDTLLRVADSMLAARRIDSQEYVISKDTMEADLLYKAS